MKVAVSATLAALTIAFSSASFVQQALKAGSTTAGQPMSGINPQTKEFEGVAVELLKAVAKGAGLEVQFVPMNFAELQPALNDNRIDVIAASYGITPARQKLVDFTEPYGSYRGVLIVRAENQKAYCSTADFKGMSIAIPKGSAYVSSLKEADRAGRSACADPQQRLRRCLRKLINSEAPMCPVAAHRGALVAWCDTAGPGSDHVCSGLEHMPGSANPVKRPIA